MNHTDQHDREHMKNEDKDRDAVSRAYRDARDSDVGGMAPPAALDDAILAAAHRAVHSGPKLAGSSWIRRWTPQLAVAAVVVLSVSVVFVSIEERPDLAPASIQSIAPVQKATRPEAVISTAEKTITGAVPAPETSVEADKVARKLPSEAAARDASAVRQERAAAVSEERNVAVSPANRPAPAPQVAAAGSQSIMPPVYAPAVQSVSPAPAAPVPAPAADPFPNAISGAKADALATARKKERSDTRSPAAAEPARVEEKIAAAGSLRAKESGDAAAGVSAAASVSPPSRESSAIPVAPIGYAPTPLVKQLAPAATATSGATVAPAHAPSPALADKARPNEQAASNVSTIEDERPGPWLKRLMELREQGKFTQLREELVRFRKVHPDVVLPKALTDLPAGP